MSTLKSHWISSLFGAGLLFAFIGERLIGAGTGRMAFTGLGVLAVIAAVAWRGMRLGADSSRSRIEQSFLGLQLLGLVALALYFAQSDVWTKAFDRAFDSAFPKLSVV